MSANNSYPTRDSDDRIARYADSKRTADDTVSDSTIITFDTYATGMQYTKCNTIVGRSPLEMRGRSIDSAVR